ncbi:hypothetical protein Nmel_008669 [Mimus melanotis]
MAPPAPIYKEGDEQKKNPLSDGEGENPVSSSQLILPLLAAADMPSHASCPLAGSLEPFCLTIESKQNMEAK